jgi:hypothetical protein
MSKVLSVILIFLSLELVLGTFDKKVAVASVTARTTSSHKAEDAIDGDTNTIYHSGKNDGNPQWLKLELESPQAVITKVVIINRYLLVL